MEGLSLKNICKSFGGNQVLKSIDVTFQTGCLNCIVGGNGAGKSTLFNIIDGLIRPDRGIVKLAGQNITGVSSHKIARAGISRLFQEVRVFDKITVLENVLVAFQGQSGENPLNVWLKPFRIQREEAVNRQTARQLLAFLDLDKQEQTLAGDLSYGQQKLLAVARMLATGSGTLLFDEPCSGIHEDIMVNLMDHIKAISRQGKAVIVIEHNLEMVYKYADQVYCMDGGIIASQGSPREVLVLTEKGFFLDSEHKVLEQRLGRLVQ